MASGPRRSVEQSDETKAFVDWLYERSGLTSWDAFARAAGVSSSNISKYHTGDQIPDGYNLLRLMRAAGVLEGHEFRPVIETDRLQSIEETLADLLAGQTKLTSIVERLVPATQAPPTSQPSADGG